MVEMIGGQMAQVVYMLKPWETDDHYTVSDKHSKEIVEASELSRLDQDATELQKESHASKVKQAQVAMRDMNKDL